MRFARIILISLLVSAGGLATGMSAALAWHAWQLPSAAGLIDRYRRAGAPTQISDISPHILAALAADGVRIEHQLARQECVSRDARGLQDHIQSASCGVAAMVYYSDDELRLWWLNNALFGRGAYGIAPAARAWFAKDQAELSRAEAALLFSITRGPGRAKTDIRRLFDRIADPLRIPEGERDTALAAIVPHQ